MVAMTIKDIVDDKSALRWLESIGAVSDHDFNFEMNRTVEVEDTLGGVNRFYSHCAKINESVSYGVCRHIIRAFEEQRLTGFEECHAHLKSGECPATLMLKAEAEKGHAIFYIKGRTDEERRIEADEIRERTEAARVKHDEEWVRKIAARRAAEAADDAAHVGFPAGQIPAIAVKSPPKSKVSAMDAALEGGSFAEVINAEMAKVVRRGAVTKPAPAPIEVSPAPAKPGQLSLLEIAKRKLAQKETK